MNLRIFYSIEFNEIVFVTVSRNIHKNIIRLLITNVNELFLFLFLTRFIIKMNQANKRQVPPNGVKNTKNLVFHEIKSLSVKM